MNDSKRHYIQHNVPSTREKYKVVIDRNGPPVAGCFCLLMSLMIGRKGINAGQS
jgi:hypothetical protein